MKPGIQHRPLALWHLAWVTALSVAAVTAFAAGPPCRYTLLDAGTIQVQDTQTGLIWQRAIPYDGGEGDSGPSWAAALAVCAQLAADAGAPWRLPSVKELTTLVDFTVASGAGPTIDATAFPGTPADLFWTSTFEGGNYGAAWLVSFSAGYAYYDSVSLPALVRCVR